MNKDRRQRLYKLCADIENIKEQLNTIKEEEADCLSRLPESFQEGEKGQTMQTKIDSMEESITSLESAVENITEVIN